MKSRLDLHTQLKQICDKVYYQPGNNTTLTYPCITYNIIDELSLMANDISHTIFLKYGVTYISDDPEKLDEIIEKLSKIPYSSFMQSTIIDGLYHIYFEITNQ